MSENHSSTQVLARKWRPRELSALVGQEHVVRALRHALQTRRLHHAYLFTGTRGVGKTTLARILAKALNCDTGVTDTPCGQCSACREIDQGRFVDLLEVDAATNTGVDEMRDLLENAAYAPTAGRYKVYVIDEVHMLSKSAFNAMLKTLEEPPPHILFILATTDPQKIPVTVLSRCLQFNLKQMPPAHVVEHLQRVLAAEGVPYEMPALQLIGRAAQGSMRDALSLTDQAIAHGAGQLTHTSVQDMLGAVDQRHLVDILEALADQDAVKLLAVADDMAARSLPMGQALQNLASLLYRLSVAHLVPGAIAEDDPDRDLLLSLAQRFSPSQLQLHYQIASHGRRELVYAPDEATGFGMCLLRMLAFLPQGGDAPATSGASGSGAASASVGAARRPASDAATASPRTSAGAAARSDMDSTEAPRAAAAARPQSLVAVHAAASAAAVMPVVPEPEDFPSDPGELLSDDDLPLTRPAAALPKRQSTTNSATDTTAAVGAASSAAVSASAATGSTASPRTALDALGLLVPSRAAGSTVAVDSSATQSGAGTGASGGSSARAGASAAALAALKTRPDPDQRAAAHLSLVPAVSPPQDVPASAQPAAASANAERQANLSPAQSVTAAVVAPAVPQVSTGVLASGLSTADGTPPDWPDRDAWPTYVQALPATGLLRQMLDRTQLDAIDLRAEPISLTLTVAVRAYLDPQLASRAGEILSAVHHRPVGVKVQLGEATITAQARADALQRQRQAQAEASVESDPFVRAMRYSLGATVVPGSIRPFDPGVVS